MLNSAFICTAKISNLLLPAVKPEAPMHANCTLIYDFSLLKAFDLVVVVLNWEFWLDSISISISISIMAAESSLMRFTKCAFRVKKVLFWIRVTVTEQSDWLCHHKCFFFLWNLRLLCPGQRIIASITLTSLMYIFSHMGQKIMQLKHKYVVIQERTEKRRI